MVLRIGTRGSKLALAQSEWVKGKIEAQHSGVRVELVRVKTTGDKILDSPLSKIGGKALFVKEIEEALLRKDVDLAVHSMKDVPAEVPEGLTFTTYPHGARVGTGSLRRIAQLLRARADLELVPVRGNVDTRLRKLEAGEFHAIILAAAGLRRLGFADRIGRLLSEEQILPAIGQGALGLEVRQDDEQTIGLIKFLNHEETEVTVKAERAFLRELQGGCQVPMAAYCRYKGKQLHLKGMVAELDGSEVIRDELWGEKKEAEEMGITLARRLLAAGANKILEKIYGKT
jgi:hydroxymethylbilane synthase